MENQPEGKEVIDLAFTHVTPVAAHINFHPNQSDFRLKISTQVKRPDGTRYEVEVEVDADLGNVLNTLIAIWSGTRYIDGSSTEMLMPSPVLIPDRGVTWGEFTVQPEPVDVGEVDEGDDLDDVALALAIDGP